MAARGETKNFPPHDVLRQDVRVEGTRFFRVETGRELKAQRLEFAKPNYATDITTPAVRRAYLTLTHPDYRQKIYGEVAAAILHFELPECIEIWVFPKDGDPLNVRRENLVVLARDADATYHGEESIGLVRDTSHVDHRTVEQARLRNQLFDRYQRCVKIEDKPLGSSSRKTAKLYPKPQHLRVLFEYDPDTGMFKSLLTKGKDWTCGRAYKLKSDRSTTKGLGSKYYLYSRLLTGGDTLPADKAAIILQLGSRLGVLDNAAKVYHQNFDPGDNRAVNLALFSPLPFGQGLIAIHDDSMWAAAWDYQKIRIGGMWNEEPRHGRWRLYTGHFGQCEGYICSVTEMFRKTKDEL